MYKAKAWSWSLSKSLAVYAAGKTQCLPFVRIKKHLLFAFVSKAFQRERVHT